MKAFLLSILNPITQWLGLSRNLYTGLILLGLFVVLVVAIIVIVCVVKSKKNKAKTDAQIEAMPETVASEIKEEEAKAEPASEPVVEQEQPAVIEEVKAEEPVVTEEVKAEEPVAQPAPAVVEEVKAEKKPVTKKAPAKKSTAAKKPATKKATGKWVVETRNVGEYMSKLVAANGEVMLSSEIYSSEEGARAGIATIIKCVENGKFLVYQDKKKNYYYKLKTVVNRLLCVGEIYKSEAQCLKAVETVKRLAPTAVVAKKLVVGEKYVDYTPADLSANKGPKGKWKIETLENGKFSAKLYASNGQLMIATEEVSQKSTASKTIESVKKNASEGNFIIDHDKFGRYYYKLRNAQKSVICIGEAYDSLDSCVSALESVRRFAVNAVIAE